MDDELARLTLIEASLMQQQKADQKAYSKLEGSIEYAIENINRTYGDSSYVREEISAADADTAIANGDAVLADMNRIFKEAEKAYSYYYKQYVSPAEWFSCDVEEISVWAGASWSRAGGCSGFRDGTLE